MKNSFLKNMALLVFTTAFCSCNNKNSQDDGIQSDIDNTSTSTDSVTSFKADETQRDTANLKNVDAARLSDGKDSVKGEVTPPNANKQ